MASLAILAYRCEVAGRPSDSLDIKARYFTTDDFAEVERRVRAEAPHTYRNEHNETVAWPLAEVLAIEPLEAPADGSEVAGFITGCDEFAKWARR